MMSEQELADLFSEQVDRLLQGEATNLPAEAGDLPELLGIVERSTLPAQFQASAAAQAAFQSQLAGWFGAAGGSAMTILGLSKIWFISIIVVVVTSVFGLSLVTVITTGLFIFRPGTPTAVAGLTGTPLSTPAASVTTAASPSAEGTATGTAQPAASPTAVASGTPGVPASQLPPLIFRTDIYVASLCQGAYTVQRTLVNSGNGPIDDAALAWEVVEGGDLVDQVSLASANAEALPVVDTTATTGGTATTVAASNVITPEQVNYIFFSPIAVNQQVKVDLKVKVKDTWWDKPDGTTVKVKLHVKNKIRVQGAWSGAEDGHYQTVTVVKQGAQWVTLTGFPQNHGEGQMLLDGHVVVVNSCTGLPATWPQGAKIKVVGWLQPDGTFIAINIIVVNVNVNLDFNSGVPQPGDDGGDDGGDGGDGGGGGKGGSNKGGSHKGGSKGGS